MLFEQPLNEMIQKKASSPLVFAGLETALTVSVMEMAATQSIAEAVMVRTYHRLIRIDSGIDLIAYHPIGLVFPKYPQGVELRLEADGLHLTMLVQIRLRNLPKIHLSVIDQEMRDRDREIVVKLQEMANAINATCKL
jgi:hypothetical protein